VIDRSSHFKRLETLPRLLLSPMVYEAIVVTGVNEHAALIADE